MKKFGVILLVVGLVMTGCGASHSVVKSDEKVVKEEKNETVSDTILWFNGTYAIISTWNNRDLKLVGGYKKDDPYVDVKAIIEDSWGITNRQEAEEMIIWLTAQKGAHNESLLEDYYYYGFDEYTREELVEEIKTFTKEEQAHYLVIYDTVEKYGDNAILSWDLTRAMNLLGWFYLADYYTYEEAMDKSLEIAQRLQSTYNSWEEMAEGYVNGYLYWKGDDPEDEDSGSYLIRQIYEQLKADENSPYHLPWDLEFQKDW